MNNNIHTFIELYEFLRSYNDDIKIDILNDTKNNNYGWSIESCFLLKQGIKEEKPFYINEFQNEEENLKIWYKIFGKKIN